MNKTYKGQIEDLLPHQIFVFGSNTEGRHGKGAALTAVKKYGAKYGKPRGMQGQSYAIVTKDLTKKEHPSVTREEIIHEINVMYAFAENNPDKEFWVVYSAAPGTVNLNGYSPKQMGDMFTQMVPPLNVVFEETFYNKFITPLPVISSEEEVLI